MSLDPATPVVVDGSELRPVFDPRLRIYTVQLWQDDQPGGIHGECEEFIDPGECVKTVDTFLAARGIRGTTEEEKTRLHHALFRAKGGPDLWQFEAAWNPGSPGWNRTKVAEDQAVAEEFGYIAATAGDVLLDALAEYHIRAHADAAGAGYAIPLDPDTPQSEVWQRSHLSVADREASADHALADHTGWTVFSHGENGEAAGDPLYSGGDGGPVDCAGESQTAAVFIAEWLTRPRD